jgi:hypothetical protein
VAAKPAKRPARATKSGIRRKVVASAWIVKTENTSHEFASCRQIPKWLEIALEMIDPIPGKPLVVRVLTRDGFDLTLQKARIWL